MSDHGEETGNGGDKNNLALDSVPDHRFRAHLSLEVSTIVSKLLNLTSFAYQCRICLRVVCHLHRLFHGDFGMLDEESGS